MIYCINIAYRLIQRSLTYISTPKNNISNNHLHTNNQAGYDNNEACVFARLFILCYDL